MKALIFNSGLGSRMGELTNNNPKCLVKLYNGETILERQIRILSELGINLNLAPVVDVATSPDDYMYERTIKQDTQITAQYAQTVVKASKNTGVSYTLKHFPRIW